MADARGPLVPHLSSQHAYVTMFYTPLDNYKRTARLTVTFSILFMSLCSTCIWDSCSVVGRWKGNHPRSRHRCLDAAPNTLPFPLSRSTRPDLSVSALAAAVNALFYQFGNADTFSIITIALRFLVGVLSSVIVYIPTTFLALLFRRIRRRDFLGRTQEEFSSSDLADMKIDVRSPGVRGRVDLRQS